MEYKDEYLQLAKNAKTLEELVEAIKTDAQTIISWATEFIDEKLKRPEFFEAVRVLRFPEPVDKGGRPEEYKEIYVEAVDKYIATTGKEQTELPTVEGFAIFLGKSKKTLYNWGDKHPEFLHALEKIMLHQGVQLINDGIYGGKEVNATIVKLLLQNNHGMREKTDVTTNDKDIPTPIYGGSATKTV